MNWRYLLIIVVLAFTAYLPTLRVGFIWDDHVIIEANPTIRSWSWQNVTHDFTSDNSLGRGDSYYRPLQAISDRIDYTFWGLHAWGYHLTNLLFHIGNALLLYLLITRLGYSALVALLACTLFVVHPIDVEEFIVVSGRCTQMGFFFVLSTILLALEPGFLYAGLALLCYVLAMLAKESSVIAPALLALVFFVRHEERRRYAILIPMLVLTAAYLAVHQAVVHQTIGSINPALFQLFMVKVFPRVCFHFASLLLWPWNLHNHRLIPHLTHLWPLYGLAFLALAAAAIRSKNRTGLFCFFWFVLWLLPAIPLMVSGAFMLDHWGYAMGISLFLPLSIGLVKLWDSRSPAGRWAGGAYFVYLITLALLVHLNVALRGSDEKIYRWALHFTTSNPIKYNLGIYLVQTGRMREGLDYLEEVKDDYPNDPNLALAIRQALATLKSPVDLRHKKPKA